MKTSRKIVSFGRIPSIIDADPVLRAAYDKGHAALAERDAIELCCSPEWRAAHQKASALYQSARELFDARFYAC